MSRVCPRVPFAVLFGLAITLVVIPPAHAQPWAAFDVPDSLLPAALKSSGTRFENQWNALFVASLRAEGATADSLRRLAGLAQRVAVAEPVALGSTIGADALKHLKRWSRTERRVRIEAAVQESLATAAQSARAYERADSLFRSALSRYQKIHEPRRLAWVLGSLGVVTFLRGDYPAADSIYREALVARRAIGDAKMIGNTLNVLGSTNYLMGRDSTALAYLDSARVVREGTGERAALGSTLNYLGLVTLRLGSLEQAETNFENALALTVATGDSGRTADVLTNMIGLLTRRGETDRVLALAERARTIYRSQKNLADEAQLDLNVANLLILEGRFSQAATRLEHALAQTREARDVRGEVQVLLGLGRLAVVVRDSERWNGELQAAIQLADSLGDVPAQAASRSNLAVVSLYANDREGARQLANAAFDRARASGDSALVHDAATTVGNVAFAGGDTSALAWYRVAETAGQGGLASVRASDLNNLGTGAILTNQLDQAEDYFKRALALAEDAGQVEWTWPPLLGLGEVAERRGDFSAALAHARRAATLIDTLRTRQAEAQAITLFARRLFAYEALIHLLGKLAPRFPDSAYAAEAFAWSERARARALLDLVAAAGGRTGPIAPVTLSQAQAALPKGTVLLEYSLGDSSSTLWAVTRDAMQRTTLPTRSALRARIERLRRGLADPEQAMSDATLKAGHELYRSLVAPAEPMLKGRKRVIVAPDGPLAYVPFEALMVRASSGSPRPEDYLVHRFAVSYTPSMTTLMARDAAGAASGVVALADPAFLDGDSSSAALPRLPSTAAEISALRGAVDGVPMVALTGTEATRTRLLGAGLDRSGLIHLATHGQADELEPSRSGLWLAAESGQPSFLSVPDVLDLKLNANLVTLSACETGVGRLERGEGVIGLARAFMAAGSRCVLVSLWQVNDRSTADLMTDFYRRLLSAGAPRDQALAEAKRTLLKNADTRSPFHWAPFVLVGQSGAIP